MRTFTTITVIVLALPLILSAQRYGEEDNLHIPPKLVVTQGWGDGLPEVWSYHSTTPQFLLPLPMIFFDNPGEWVIPERYKQFRSPSKSFDYADTNSISGWSGQYPKYYEILNVVGYRMSRDTTAVVGLRGGFSTEGGEDSALARERALVVREYLDLIWNIDTARLPILPPVSSVDSSSNLMLQEEARRLEFVTDDSAIFAPVPYSIVTSSPLNASMALYVTPNVEPDRIVSIEVRILDDDGELINRDEIPGHPDSTVYRLRANWWSAGKELGKILVEVRVTMVDGRYRSSEVVPIPVRVENMVRGGESSEYSRQLYGLIPFFPPGDTVLGARQKWLIAEYVRDRDSLNQLHGQQGVFVMASGLIEMSESPEMERAEIDAMVMERRASGFSEREEMLRSTSFPQEQSQLYIFQPEPQEDGMYEVESIELADISEEGVDAIMEEVEEDDMAVSRYDADSLGQARARRVVAYIRDSLRVPILNSQMSAELDQYRGEEFAQLRSTGVRPIREGGVPLYTRPEDRWYHRGVSLYLESALQFDYMKKQSEEQLKRYHERENRARESGEETIDW